MCARPKFLPGDRAVLMIDIYKKSQGRKEKDFLESIRFPALKTIVRIVNKIPNQRNSEYRIEIQPGVQRVISGANLEHLSILDQIFGEGYLYETGIM